MEAVGFVHFEDPKSTHFRPSTAHEGEQVIPAASGLGDIQGF